jgi:hypothetical protein
MAARANWKGVLKPVALLTQAGDARGLIRGSDRAGRLARLQAPTSLRSVGSAYSDRGELRVSVGDGQ